MDFQLELEGVEDTKDYSQEKYNSPVPYKNVDIKSDKPFLEAFALNTIPARAGIYGSYFADKVINSFGNTNDDVDPSFVPFEVWKDNEHSEEELQTVMEMQNWDDYYKYTELVGETRENRKIIDESGFAGQAASFLLNVGTDPTTYMGFGLAKMLNLGVSKAAAFSASAAVGAAASEGIEQIIDPEKKAEDSIKNVAMSAVFGGLLGKATETIGTLASKKIVSFDNVEDAAKKSMSAAIDLGNIRRTEGIGANFLENIQKSNVGGSYVGRLAAKALSKLSISAKLRGQTSNSNYTSDVYSKVFGIAVRSEDNYLGVRTGKSVDEVVGYERDFTANFIKKTQDIKNNSLKKGIVVNENSLKRTAILSQYTEDAVKFDNFAKQINATEYEVSLAKEYDNFFRGYWRPKLENVKGFKTLSNRGVTIKTLPEKINAQFDVYKDKIKSQIMLEKLNAPNILATNKQLLDQLMIDARSASKISKKAINREMADIISENDRLKDIIDMTDEAVLNEATDTAIRHSVGDFTNSVSDPITGKSKPRAFNFRNSSIDSMIDFMEVRPEKIMADYSQDVSPFYAMQDVFGTTNIDDILDEYSEKIAVQIRAAREGGDQKLLDKLQNEKVTTIDDIKKGFEQITGEFFAKEVSRNKTLNTASIIASDAIRAVSLSNQVAGSLSEVLGSSLHHGLKGIAKTTATVSKSIFNSEIRGKVFFAANRMASGLENVKNKALISTIDAEVSTGGLYSKAAVKAGEYSAKYSRYNLSVHYDTFVRSAVNVASEGILSDYIKAYSSGKKIGDHLVADLAYLGIDKSNIKPIADMIKKYGTDDNGIFISNIDNWDDKLAAETFTFAVRRDLKRTSIQPSVGDTPFFFRTNEGRIIAAFKSWPVAAMQKYGLMQLQRQDMGSVTGALAFVGWGALTNLMYDAATGKEPSTDPDELLWGGITRSGIIGVLPDMGGNYAVNRWLDIQSGGAKYTEFQDPNDVLSGPFGGLANDVGNVLSIPLEGEAENKDLKSIIDLLPIPTPFVKQALRRQLDENNQ
jgi:hypothetical protein